MTDGHEWRNFIRLHEAELLGGGRAASEEHMQPAPAGDQHAGTDHAWPVPRESVFLARIDPWIVPIVLVLLAVIALLAIASHH